DTAPPTVTIASGPEPVTAATTAAFLLAAEANATLECRLDGGAWNTCDDSSGYASLAPGAHALEARARDAAGNTSAIVRWDWMVDTTAPDPPAVTTPPDGALQRSAAVALSGTTE